MNLYTINTPMSDVVFEKLCLELLKRHWSRKGLERFAKKDEDQYGVDIFDTLGETPQYAAQCNLKEEWKSLAPKEIRTEVKKAETSPSKLDHYAILTTGKTSGEAQLAIAEINQQHKAASLFTVELFTWEKITELIRQYPEVEQSSMAAWLRGSSDRECQSGFIDTLMESVSSIAQRHAPPTKSVPQAAYDAVTDNAEEVRPRGQLSPSK